MSYPRASFPESIWNGLTNNRDRLSIASNVNPNAEDWERIAAEVIAIQTVADTTTLLGNITADITIDATSSQLALVDSTTGDITITLPLAANMEGKKLHFKRIDDSGNAITLDANGSETIDGETTQSLSVQYSGITMISNGSGWYII